jgi:hypothetical protein
VTTMSGSLPSKSHGFEKLTKGSPTIPTWSRHRIGGRSPSGPNLRWSLQLGCRRRRSLPTPCWRSSSNGGNHLYIGRIWALVHSLSGETNRATHRWRKRPPDRHPRLLGIDWLVHGARLVGGLELHRGGELVRERDVEACQRWNSGSFVSFPADVVELDRIEPGEVAAVATELAGVLEQMVAQEAATSAQ